MRRYKASSDDENSAAERLAEAALLDSALGAMGSKYSSGYDARLTTLDGAICAFVDGLRSDDVGPAQVLINLKEHLAAFTFHSGDVDAFAIRRCIARYYEA